MPRIAASGLSIDQLEQILATRRSQIRKLSKQRTRLQRELEALDRQIGQLGGNAAGGRGGPRARNEKSLVEMIEAALSKTGKPTGVGDIVDAVQKGGYQSSSANFRGIVNQTLIKEKQFQQASRGMYQLKK